MDLTPRKPHLNTKEPTFNPLFKNLKDNIKLISDLLLDIPDETEYENAAKDVENIELDLEEKENEAAKFKNMFDVLSTHLQAKAKKETSIANAKRQPDPKPKFKPKDICIPSWEGDLINFNA